jgi:hypothetical protein
MFAKSRHFEVDLAYLTQLYDELHGCSSSRPAAQPAFATAA